MRAIVVDYLPFISVFSLLIILIGMLQGLKTCMKGIREELHIMCKDVIIIQSNTKDTKAVTAKTGEAVTIQNTLLSKLDDSIAALRDRVRDR